MSISERDVEHLAEHFSNLRALPDSNLLKNIQLAELNFKRNGWIFELEMSGQPNAEDLIARLRTL